jgi:thiol-disulfide isomerase/thioredoxin
MRKIAFVGLLSAFLLGLTGSLQKSMAFPGRDYPKPLNRSSLPDFGVAPELLSTAWLNTVKPLRLTTLRGKVLLLEMWTFSCINCIHILPYVQAWYIKYQKKGLAVIGNHYPEYSFEHEILNIAASVKERGVTYPIAQDNTGATWTAYQNRFWPTIYLIDKVGHIRLRNIGEGSYDAIDDAIKELLDESYPAEVQPEALSDSYVSLIQTTNVYRGPASDSELLGAVDKGSTFVVLEKRNGWYKISYNDGEGYLAADPQRLVFVAGTHAN